jgi:hypothetical protein
MINSFDWGRQIQLLSGNPHYRGGMKQIHLRFPPADGTAEIRRIGLANKP